VISISLGEHGSFFQYSFIGLIDSRLIAREILGNRVFWMTVGDYFYIKIAALN
jgi:hypothetical protein